ncbi:unnamed protein product [Didymodactylos carnosus]|uniref:Uncharacterized protein n=1 Tax=Didymodactylos carnosus TaxID=1234261 RepID=A0A815TPS0_9BILA|nr:unnamed protein product [Didymodactylos carnosus]CAF1506803.1 unnamed protein product [Didymodactylos carnosus]CAF4172278.1 unnamed protein product [Didymodactylos carnosus]CAF4368020.1 unnamed protein product [Didymodactylos carnosus]
MLTEFLKTETTIYSWGGRSELYDLIQYNLFEDDINIIGNFINVQQQYGDKLNYCDCEFCLQLNKDFNDKWSLQDVMAHDAKLLLNKEFTMTNQFHLGLDPRLYNQTSEQKEFRYNLTIYTISMIEEFENM